METSNIIKQAKSDIFKELYTIINFYIKRGAKPVSLKKYYKNNKRFSDLLEDIKNKGVNLVEDEKEYQKLVRVILNDMLDDFIAKEKDKKENKNMKHIKEFNSFEVENESLFESYYDDDDDEFSLRSYYLNKLQDFNRRFQNVKTDEELIALEKDVNEFEKKSNLEEIEGEWSDFRVYLDRKKEEMLILEFKYDELNNLLKEFKEAKTESALESVMNKMKQLAESKSEDIEFMKEFVKFITIYNNNIEKVLKKIGKKRK